MYVARLPNNRRNVTRCRVSNSRSNTKITRIILLAGALLALLLLATPMRHAAHAQANLDPETIDYAEGGTSPVAAYTAVDPEGESITWTKSGTDAEVFTLEDGVLKFVNTPDYENGGDNSYSVTVTASDGSSADSTQIVTVNVVNLEEPGVVTLSTRQPRDGIELTATHTDPDGDVAELTWQWARSPNGTNAWTDIVDEDDDQVGKTATYTPGEDDVGHFLRVTATYDDGQGEDKVADEVSANAVDEKLYVNAAPTFPDQDPDMEDVQDDQTREIAENSPVGTPIGEPVEAMDDARDVLTYTLGGADGSKFDIDSATGQIKVKAGNPLDFEVKPSYEVQVTATDPSGLNLGVDVTIDVIDVDETPVVSVAQGGVARTHLENTTTLNPVALFEVVDEEDGNSFSDFVWTLAGADGDSFEIGSNAILTFESMPDFEAPGDANRNNVYEVTVQATDSAANTGTLDVTVTVTNVEEDGEITLSNRQPEAGVSITATLTDPDGSISGVTWQWQASDINIEGATSRTYTPVQTTDTDETNVDKFLTVIATYTDGFGQTETEVNSAFQVQGRDTNNMPPEFKDAQDQALTSVDREVAENSASPASVGDPVIATDPDDTNLTYSLEGRDAGFFDIGLGTGEIEVGEGTSLDFEARKSYTVTVRAKDASNDSDSVTVKISVTNVDEDPEITSGPMTVDYAENGTATVATFTATDPEDDSASPRLALAWSLAGADATDFTIDGGMLKFETPPDYEDDQSAGSNNVYRVTVTIADSDTQTDTQDVMVKVTNVEEAGTVSLDRQQPQEEVLLTATLDDPDGRTLTDRNTDLTDAPTTWQWSRSRSRSSGWTDIVSNEDTVNPNPNANMYTPRKEDVGYYLRAAATYKDGESGDDTRTVHGVSNHVVRKKPYVNTAPMFLDAEGMELTSTSRMVPENSSARTPVGAPVAATDEAEFGPDTLTYTLDNTGAASFDIDSGTGQIRVKAGVDLDHEEDETYTVTVTVTDPSHTQSVPSTDMVTVTITVTDVDETPTIEAAGPTAVDFVENTVITTPVGRYMATDPEDEDADLKWSWSGVDGSKFSFDSDNGQLSFEASPDYESPADSGRNNVYNVTVEVTDSGGNTSTRAVTVTVTDLDEDGEVTLSNLQPEDGIEIEASLTDPDGRISNLTWQWATTSNKSDTPGEEDEIDGATSATYKPVSGEVAVGEWLWAIASYNDGEGQNKTARVVSENAVQAPDTGNDPPKFPDQDDQIEGDQTDQTRTVAEDIAAGANVGDAVVAMDEDDTNLTYTLGGVDKDSFAIERANGQIAVGDDAKLNFESKDTYTVTVTATDATGDSATATVTITVTDVDESPELSKKALVVVGDERIDYLENSTDPVETYRAAGPDSVGASWSLAGTDASRFALSSGVLSFRSAPNYEAPTDLDTDNVYNVTVRASKGSLRDERTVTIKVTNLDEPGTISLSPSQPGVGIEITATLTDPDGGVTSERWQWSRSPDGTTRWSDIQGGNSATYTPVLADVSNYLRVTVNYTDAQGASKRAVQVSTSATNVDNDGVVTFSSTAPQVGDELTASLSDPDGGVTGETWQWARSPNGSAPWADIVGATTNAYTPVALDDDNFLRATVIYTDGDGPGKTANAITANAVSGNTAPVFPASETGARSVYEGVAAGTDIGAPVAAEDTPGDTLTYTLGGTDVASFDIVAATGQLQTRVALDTATKATYTVTVTATDTGGLNDTVTVTITVTGSTLGPLGDRYDANNDGRIDKDEIFIAIDDYFDSVITKAEIFELIDLYFSG